jgi:MFS superfamily sulfate permease-like transporter
VLNFFLPLAFLAALIVVLSFTTSTLEKWKAADDDKALTRALGLWTGVLATATVLGAIFAGLSLNAIQGQLDEMRKTAIDTKQAIEATNRLATAAENSRDVAVDTERRELRAYLGVDNTELHCPLCLTTDPTKPIEIRPEDILNNMVILYMHNGGRTPAYNVNGRGML